MAAPIPCLDLSGFVSGDAASKLAAARAWDEAMSSVGVCHVTGHGVDADAVRAADAAARAFFLQPADVKAKSAAAFYGDLGYCAPGVEAVSRTHEDAPQRPADAVESFVIHNVKDDKQVSEQFNAAMARYWVEMEKLMHALMRLSALALGLDEGFFAPFYDNHHSVLRLAHYPPSPARARAEVADAGGAGGAAQAQLRYGEHTDYIGLTILRHDQPGLEVRLPDGRWVGVPPVSGELAFTINSADLVAQWTNDRWRSPLHRVANGAAGGGGRLSLVFFSGPANDAVVTCLPGCGAPRYPPTTAGAYLQQKLAASNDV